MTIFNKAGGRAERRQILNGLRRKKTLDRLLLSPVCSDPHDGWRDRGPLELALVTEGDRKIFFAFVSLFIKNG